VTGVLLRNAGCPVAVLRIQRQPGWARGPCPAGIAPGATGPGNV